MDEIEQLYRDLRRHLDRQVVGLPATRSGVELRILRTLFGPDEARLALHLSYKPASVSQIQQSVGAGGIRPEEVEPMLHRMAVRGVIGVRRKDGESWYSTLPIVVGMYEGQLRRLTPEFVRDTDQYFGERSFGLALLSTEVPQMRTIPVEKSLTVEHQVTTYDDLSAIIAGCDGPFAVLECICRKSAAIKGRPCRKTSRAETCMAMGDGAALAIEDGRGRAVDREEAVAIARLNQADGLVLQPSNTQRTTFVCACCGCCCGMLALQKVLPRPVSFWATNYQAAVDAGACTGCATCVERCEVNALRIDDQRDVSVVDLDRCIGCGNCVVTCPAEAMKLVRTSGGAVPPRDEEELFDVIMANKKGTLGKLGVVARLALRR